MNKNEIKKLLEDYKFNQEYLEEKVNELKNLFENEKIYSKIFNNKPFSEDKIFKNFIKEKQSEIELIKEIKHNNLMVMNLINNLDQPHKNILYFKYIKSLTFDEIALKMCYSTPRIYQLHSTALDLISQNI